MTLKFKRWHVRIWKNGWEYGNGKSGRWGFWPWRKELTKRLHESMYLRSTRMKFKNDQMPPEYCPVETDEEKFESAIQLANAGLMRLRDIPGFLWLGLKVQIKQWRKK